MTYRSPWAIASLFFAGLFLILWFTWFYLLTSILAIALGIIALIEIKKTGKKGKVMAMIGIVLGFIQILFFSFLLILAARLNVLASDNMLPDGACYFPIDFYCSGEFGPDGISLALRNEGTNEIQVKKLGFKSDVLNFDCEKDYGSVPLIIRPNSRSTINADCSFVPSQKKEKIIINVDYVYLDDSKVLQTSGWMYLKTS